MKSIEISRQPLTYLLVLDRDDEITATLTAFARDNAINGAHFTSIGACRRATFAYWNAASKQYERIEIAEQVEVVSLIGDVALGVDDQPRIHAHVAFGKRDGTIAGGHLIDAHVNPTLELFLTTYEGALRRKRDPQTGLPLIALE